MKKILSICMAGAMVLTMLGGCMNKYPMKKGTVNPEYSQASMLAYGGETFVTNNPDLSFYDEGVGMGITYTESMIPLMDENILSGSMLRPYYMVITAASEQLNEVTKDKDFATMTPEEQEALVAQMEEYILDVYGLFRKPAKDVIAEDEFQKWSASFSEITQLETIGTDTYYLGTTLSSEGVKFTEEEKAKLEPLFSNLDSFVNGICLFPYRDLRPTDAIGSLGNFEMKNLQGETVTQDIFKDYDLTMVNLWNMDCMPCQIEIPALNKLQESLPKNVNFISINIDSEDFRDQVQAYCAEKGITYPVILSNDAFGESFLYQLTALPTTVFVDKEGNVRGEAFIGIPGESEQRILAGYHDLVQLYLSAVTA